MRSKLRRRRRVALSAGPACPSPLASSLARMKRSMSVLGQVVSLTTGGAGDWMGCQAQWVALRFWRSKDSVAVEMVVAAGALDLPQGAPCFTQVVRSAIC